MAKKKREFAPKGKCLACGGEHTGQNCPFDSAEPQKFSAEQHIKARPSIAELEAILKADDDEELEILPNGEIRTAEGKPTTKKPLTMRENLGGEYASQSQ